MNFARATLKVGIGLAVFASLMVLEFSSYTQAVAEGVKDEPVLESKVLARNQLSATSKKIPKLVK